MLWYPFHPLVNISAELYKKLEDYYGVSPCGYTRRELLQQLAKVEVQSQAVFDVAESTVLWVGVY